MKKISLFCLAFISSPSFADYIDTQHPQCQANLERCMENQPYNVQLCMISSPDPYGADCYVEGSRPSYVFYAYQDRDKGGRSAGFPVGLSNLSKYDLDNVLSSYTLSSGYSATLFSGPNGTGDSWLIESGYNSWVGKDLNDKVSSVKVEKSEDVRPMMMYQDRDYKGTRWDLKVGLNNLVPMKAGDVLSSYKIRSGYRATLYEHPDQGGDAVVALPGSNPWIGNKWNDRISSILIEKM
ncbi:peptidase inhibitor family I36 protein [Vibrio sp. 10N.261.46.A3]|uniref:peptidase inhibitor family I36 protein n=1 Tax=Vibrio sp. 10N.261.46.A3 TaxID=3229658 RepID=UPI0035535401